MLELRTQIDSLKSMLEPTTLIDWQIQIPEPTTLIDLQRSKLELVILTDSMMLIAISRYLRFRLTH